MPGDSGQTTLGSALLGAIVPAIVTAMGGLIVAWYTHTTQGHDQAIESARAAASASAQADQQAQSVREQNRAAQIELLRDLAPRVSGTAGSPANCPLVLGLWESVYPGTPAPVLTAACPTLLGAGASPAEQHWGVALVAPSTETIACEQADFARAHGLPVATVYRLDSHATYQAVVGEYSSKSEAEPGAAFVRVTLRLDAAVVRIDSSIRPFYKFHVCNSTARDAGEEGS
jgi:hypothetical protein